MNAPKHIIIGMIMYLCLVYAYILYEG